MRAASENLSRAVRDNQRRRHFMPLLTNALNICYRYAAPLHFHQQRAQEVVMAKGQMRSNKEKKKPKADKNLKKGGPAPSPFASGKPAAGQSPNSKKS
jgi:hypothetical protein